MPLSDSRIYISTSPKNRLENPVLSVENVGSCAPSLFSSIGPLMNQDRGSCLVAPEQGCLLRMTGGCSLTLSSAPQDRDPVVRLPASSGRDTLSEFAQSHTAIVLAHLLGFFFCYILENISLIKNKQAQRQHTHTNDSRSSR